MVVVGPAVRRAALLLVAVFILHVNIVLTRPASSSPALDDNVFYAVDNNRNAKIQSILDEILEWQRESSPMQQQQRHRPFVTATFAQSLDGKLAVYEEHSTTTSSSIKTSSNYPLSGDESLLLTHALRSIHDGILVGSKTISIDNPRLSNRLWDIFSQHHQKQPRPILLDTNLEHISKLLRERTTRQQQTNEPAELLRCLPNRPIVCCSHAAAAAAFVKNNTLPSSLSSLILDGAIQLLPCDCSTGDDSQERQQLCLRDVLRRLKEQHGIQTLMVEGGATLLSSLFAGQHNNNKDSDENDEPCTTTLVDALCVTIAPKILRWGIAPTFGTALGKRYDSSTETSPYSTVIDLNPMSPRFVSLGQDTALISRWPKSEARFTDTYKAGLNESHLNNGERIPG